MWTLPEIGAVLLAASIALHIVSWAPKIRAAAAFIGVCLIGGGFLGNLLRSAALWVASLSTSLAHWALDVSVGATILTGFLVILFIADLHPKGKASARTTVVGVVLAALLMAGVSGITALNHVPSAVQNGVTNARTAVTGG